MPKFVFSLGQLKIDVIDDGMGEETESVTPVSLQENLNSMIIYINQILDRLPETEKVAFLKNDQYPNGTFVLVKNEVKTPIVPQYLLTRLQDSVPDAYQLAQGEKWGWSIANKATAISINNLDKGFEEHLVACLNKYAEEGEDLNYELDFTYKVAATIVNAPQVTASSDKKFHFTVKATK